VYIGSAIKGGTQFSLYHEVMAARCWSGFDRVVSANLKQCTRTRWPYAHAHTQGIDGITGAEIHRVICPAIAGSVAGCNLIFPIDMLRRCMQLATSKRTVLSVHWKIDRQSRSPLILVTYLSCYTLVIPKEQHTAPRQPLTSRSHRFLPRPIPGPV
jgi:hypothetical protein